MTPRAFGALLRHHRVERRLTQESLAELASLSARTIVGMERGRPPRPKTVQYLVTALELTGRDKQEFVEAGATAYWGDRAGRPAASVPRQLPADPPDFVGRHRDVAALDELLAAASGQSLAVVVSGAPGVGKTALAAHWAHRVRERFPDGQLYLDLNGYHPGGRPVPATEALSGLLEAFGVPRTDQPADPQAQVGLYRSLMADRRALLIADNARTAAQVRPLLPGSTGSLLIVTSRVQLIDLVVHDGVRPLVLDLLSVEESRELLAKRLGRSRVAAEREAADEIIDRCARLPLALAIVAARGVTCSGCSLRALAQELGDAERRLDAFAITEGELDLRSVFSWSYQALEPDTQEAFRGLAIHPGPEIGVPAAASLLGRTTSEVRSWLSDLSQAHLVTEQRPGRFALHDLVRAYANELAVAIEPNDSVQAKRRRLIDHYLLTAHEANRLIAPLKGAQVTVILHSGVACESLGDEQQGLAWFDREYEVLLRIVQLAASTGHDAATADLVWLFGAFLRRRGLWASWQEILEEAIRAAERLEDPHRLAQAYRGQAQLHLQRGSYDDARRPLEQALGLLEQVGDRAAQARVHENLAVVLGGLGDPSSAQRQAAHALRLHRSANDKTGEGYALNALGWYHAQATDYETALHLCTQALDLLTQLGDRVGQAATWDTLGFIHHGLGEFEHAVSSYQRSIDLNRALGDRHSMASALTHLGDSHAAAGRTSAARTAWLAARETLEDLTHPDVEDLTQRLDPGPNDNLNVQSQ